MIETFHKLFAAHDVDLVISGHHPHFEIAQKDDKKALDLGLALLNIQVSDDEQVEEVNKWMIQIEKR